MMDMERRTIEDMHESVHSPQLADMSAGDIGRAGEKIR